MLRTRLIINWPRFGPYHIARLTATAAQLSDIDFEVIGLETASMDATYLWGESNSNQAPWERVVLFPGHVYEQISMSEAYKTIFTQLNRLDPTVLAISGYQSTIARVMLGWGILHSRPMILMTDSKRDDIEQRANWKELVKQIIVRRFDAALCAGTLHQTYLKELGMPSDRIFLGYDVVDNEYFSDHAQATRAKGFKAGALPGAYEPCPFFLASSRFIPRKNMYGLILAYSRYRNKVIGQHPWRLVILGDGTESQKLRGIVQREKIPGVSFPGFRQIDELPSYYGLASAFIHPALQEQWGLVVNEAMAAGLPVLVSERCGCVPELVMNGRNGYTFDPENIDELADLMYACSSGQFNLQSMALASREIIAEWGPQRFAQGMRQAVYAALRIGE